MVQDKGGKLREEKLNIKGNKRILEKVKKVGQGGTLCEGKKVGL